jgi:GxxExxY protein
MSPTSRETRGQLVKRQIRPLPAEVIHDRLCSEVIDSALAVQTALGPFYPAEIYRNALVVELRRRGIHCHKNVKLTVTFRSEVVGVFEADLVVDEQILVKLTAEGCLGPRHKDQVLRGLGASGLRFGLLLDFGGPELQFSRIL